MRCKRQAPLRLKLPECGREVAVVVIYKGENPGREQEGRHSLSRHSWHRYRRSFHRKGDSLRERAGASYWTRLSMSLQAFPNFPKNCPGRLLRQREEEHVSSARQRLLAWRQSITWRPMAITMIDALVCILSNFAPNKVHRLSHILEEGEIVGAVNT